MSFFRHQLWIDRGLVYIRGYAHVQRGLRLQFRLFLLGLRVNIHRLRQANREIFLAKLVALPIMAHVLEQGTTGSATLRLAFS